MLPADRPAALLPLAATASVQCLTGQLVSTGRLRLKSTTSAVTTALRLWSILSTAGSISASGQTSVPQLLAPSASHHRRLRSRLLAWALPAWWLLKGLCLITTPCGSLISALALSVSLAMPLAAGCLQAATYRQTTALTSFSRRLRLTAHGCCCRRATSCGLLTP